MGRRAKQEYVNNKDFLAAMIEYKASVQNAETKNKSRPIVPTYVGECIMKIATHLARKPNFVNYTFKEEMISDGIENCFCLLYTSPSPRDLSTSRMPSSA